MWLFRNLVALFLVAVVSSSAINASTTPSPSTTSSPPTGTPTPTNDSDESPVIAGASIGDLETPAVVMEVDDDWEDEMDVAAEEDDDVAVEDEEAEVSEIEDYEDEYADGPTEEGFEANVPRPIHESRDIIVDKDNLVPILRTVMLAYTHKEQPSYSELLKAAGVSAFKTSLKYIGKEKLASNLLSAAKRLTNIFDDDERDNATTKVLGELAEEYLANHRFKLVLPESLLLHRKEMDEFLTRESVVEGRNFKDYKADISMARADPAVTTVLSIGPMTWMALIGGLVSIPYFLSDSTPARIDNPIHAPATGLEAPRLPFFNVQHLRRDENERPHQLQHLDPEQVEYQQRYSEWYNQWYLRYKNYYDENFPDLRQAHIQNQQQVLQQQQQLRHNPQQQQHHQQQQQHHQQQQQASQPQQVLAFRQQRPHVRPQRPNVVPKQPAHAFQHRPQHQQAPVIDMRPPPPPPRSDFARPIHPHQGQPPIRHHFPNHPGQQHDTEAARHAVSTEDLSNTFGTFQEDDKKGDSHFKVFRGVDSVNPTTVVSARPRVTPSPQPIYVHTTESSLQTESGFKPIIKSDSPVASSSPAGVTPGFRPPKQDTVLGKTPPQPRRQNSQSSSGQTIATGFQPISSQSESVPPKKHTESTTRKISSVTSKVFATTPQPAVFFRTATQKSVRVVTSSSVVLPSLSSSQGSGSSSADLPELKRPQRHQQADGPVQELTRKIPKPQSLVAPETQEVVVSASTSSSPEGGFIRTNVPTEIRIVDHEKKTVEVHTTTQAPTTQSVSVYALDPFYGSRLSRIDAIFHQLGMADEGCRVQVVCNIYKNPDAFTPFSDFLSRQLTVKFDELQRPKVSDERILRFFRYLKAAKEGQDGADCHAIYPECHVDTTTLSHQPIMTAFEKVSLLREAAGSS